MNKELIVRNINILLNTIQMLEGTKKESNKFDESSRDIILSKIDEEIGQLKEDITVLVGDLISEFGVSEKKCSHSCGNKCKCKCNSDLDRLGKRVPVQAMQYLLIFPEEYGIEPSDIEYVSEDNTELIVTVRLFEDNYFTICNLQGDFLQRNSDFILKKNILKKDNSLLAQHIYHNCAIVSFESITELSYSSDEQIKYKIGIAFDYKTIE